MLAKRPQRCEIARRPRKERRNLVTPCRPQPKQRSGDADGAGNGRARIFGRTKGCGHRHDARLAFFDREPIPAAPRLLEVSAKLVDRPNDALAERSRIRAARNREAARDDEAQRFVFR
jgi:hypothetical protein